MERKTKKIPRLLLKSLIKPAATPDLCLNSSNVISPHFTIRVTEFTQDMSRNTVSLNRSMMSTNISRSIKKIVPRSSSSSVSADNESSPAKKKIKMSEEIPSKRVILVLPNESSPLAIRNNDNEEVVTTLHDYHEKNTESPVTEAKQNQLMTDFSDRPNGDDRFNHKTKSSTMNSVTEVNTDEGFHETPLLGETLINNNIDEKVHATNISNPPSNKLTNSLGNINTTTNEQISVTTSTPKLSRNSPPRRQTMRIKKLSKSETVESRNIPLVEKLTQSTVESLNPSASQQQSMKIVGKIPVLENHYELPLSPLLLSNESKPIINQNSTSGYSSFRRININGLTLKAIDPSILKDSRFRERIQVLNRSRLDETTSKVDKSSKSQRISEGVLTPADSPNGINKKNHDCEECTRLRSEMNTQWQTILNLKRDLLKSTAAKCEKPLFNSTNDGEVLESKIFKQMDDMNKQLSEDLRRERVYNKRLRTGIINRDKHIEELECELAHVSKIFGEMETKSVSLKKLILSGSQPAAEDDFFSDFVSVDYSDIESLQHS